MMEDEIRPESQGFGGPLGKEASVLPVLESTTVVLVDERDLFDAWQFVAACERCFPGASLRFDYLIEAVMDGEPSTEYLMWRLVSCPACGNDIHEKTRIVARTPED
jgi:hypothetical protein